MSAISDLSFFFISTSAGLILFSAVTIMHCSFVTKYGAKLKFAEMKAYAAAHPMDPIQGRMENITGIKVSGVELTNGQATKLCDFVAGLKTGIDMDGVIQNPELVAKATYLSSKHIAISVQVATHPFTHAAHEGVSVGISISIF